MKRTASPAAVIGTLLLGAAAVLVAGVTRARATALRATWPPEADLMYLPKATTLRRLALGHTELAADLVAARANVYFGTQLATKAPQRWLDQYLHTAVDLDPRFQRLYLSGAAMLVYHGGKITVDQVERATGLLERGARMFPTDWSLPFQIGFNRFFELPGLTGPDDRRVAAWRQSGLEALRQAALYEGVPPWLPNLTARLLTKEGAGELAIRHLEQAYAATSSAETRAQIRGKLATLHRERAVVEIEAGREELEAELARGYDYAPEAFSLIAGPRVSRPAATPSPASAPATMPAPAAPPAPATMPAPATTPVPAEPRP